MKKLLFIFIQKTIALLSLIFCPLDPNFRGQIWPTAARLCLAERPNKHANIYICTQTDCIFCSPPGPHVLDAGWDSKHHIQRSGCERGYFFQTALLPATHKHEEACWFVSWFNSIDGWTGNLGSFNLLWLETLDKVGHMCYLLFTNTVNSPFCCYCITTHRHEDIVFHRSVE